MIKGSFYFIGRSPSSKLSLSILVAIDTGGGDVCFSRDLARHVIKVLNDFIVKNPSSSVAILSSLVAIGTLVVEI